MLKPFEEQEKLRSHRTKKSNPKHLHCFKEKVAAQPNNVLHTRRIANGTNKIYALPPMLTHSALSTLRTSRIDAQSYRIEQKNENKNHHYKPPYRVVTQTRAHHTPFFRGMYGIVRSAISKQSGISYAAKFLRRRRRGQCCLNEINHEIAVLMLCADSDHVVKLQAVHETRSEIALILEL